MWIVDATNIRTGGMANLVYGVSPKENVRRIPEDNRVDLVAEEEEQERRFHGESRRGGLLHSWEGNDFDLMA